MKKSMPNFQFVGHQLTSKSKEVQRVKQIKETYSARSFEKLKTLTGPGFEPETSGLTYQGSYH